MLLLQTDTAPVKETVGNLSRDKQRLSSKTAFVAELVPSNRELVEFSIEFPSEVADSLGVLAKVATVLSRHKVNLVTGFHNSDRWGLFADVTEIDSSVNQIVKELSSLGIVSKVSLGKEVSEGIIVDTLHQRLTWGQFRVLIVRADVMSSIVQSIKGIFGPEGRAGKALVHYMGEAAGRSFYKGLATRMGVDQAELRVEDIIGLLGADGWGDFRLTSLDLNRMTASVTLVDSFECAHEADSHSSYACDFIRGNLAGVFSEMFGKRMDAIETSCVSRGDAKCIFEIAPSTIATTFGKAFTT